MNEYSYRGIEMKASPASTEGHDKVNEHSTKGKEICNNASELRIWVASMKNLPKLLCQVEPLSLPLTVVWWIG